MKTSYLSRDSGEVLRDFLPICYHLKAVDEAVQIAALLARTRSLQVNISSLGEWMFRIMARGRFLNVWL